MIRKKLKCYIYIFFFLTCFFKYYGVHIINNNVYGIPTHQFYIFIYFVKFMQLCNSFCSIE